MQINSETRFVWDGQNEIGAVEKETLTELRVLGSGLGAEIGAMVLLELHQKAFVPLHDHRGSLVVLVDPTAQQTETYRYTAFGEPITPTTLSPWRFSSKRTDPETSFIYFGRRYYNPHLGRWITCDPSGFSDGPNLYAYVHNAPLTQMDFYGLYGLGVGKYLGMFSRMACRGLEWTGANLLPIPYVQNFVESIGRWGAGEVSVQWGVFFLQLKYYKKLVVNVMQKSTVLSRFLLDDKVNS